MKKNKWMRLAALMLVLCMITTCAVSGTYAKYVTKDSGIDQARVAKFGVVLDVNGSLFEDSYLKADANTPGDGTQSAAEITVLAGSKAATSLAGSNGKDRVVAPGTKNTEGMSFSIKGTPEVAVKVEIALTGKDGTGKPIDIFLAKGTYRDWTQAGQDDDYSGTFDVPDGGYYPVVFTLVEKAANGANTIGGAAGAITDPSNRFTVDTSADNQTKITGTLSDLQKVFAKLTELMAQVNPNYVFDNEFVLTWEWAFEQDPAAPALYDKADTLLGNLATEGIADFLGTADDKAFKDISKWSGSAWTGMGEGTDFSIGTDFMFTITVTQVD